MMEMQAIVGSSNVAEVGYDPQVEALVVVFRGGGRYRYTPFSPASYIALMAAESKGRWLALNVTWNPAIRCEKLPPDAEPRVAAGYELPADRL